ERAVVALARMHAGDAQRLACVGPPAGHAERVRDDARARLKVRQEARLQPADELGQQIHGHDGGAREVGGEHIALYEARAIGNPGALRVVTRSAHERFIELDAQTACAEAACGSNDNAAVARAEVDYVVLSARAGERQHALDHLVRRADEGDAPFVLRARREAERSEEQAEKGAHRKTVDEKRARLAPGSIFRTESLLLRFVALRLAFALGLGFL